MNSQRSFWCLSKRCPTRKSHSRGVIPVRCSSADQDLVSRYEERVRPTLNPWRHLARRLRISHRKRYTYSTASSGDKKDLNRRKNSTSGKPTFVSLFFRNHTQPRFTLKFGLFSQRANQNWWHKWHVVLNRAFLVLLKANNVMFFQFLFSGS